MNRGIRILPLPSVNGLLGGQVSGYRLGQLLFLECETILEGGLTTSWSTACRLDFQEKNLNLS